MRRPPSLIAIVMHGSGRYYLEPLFAAGRLPHLARLAAEGHQRYFRTVFPVAAGAWVTILTGQSVGVHGVIDYVDLDARSYDGLAGRYATTADYADHTVQTALSVAGRRIASIYLPMTSPPWPVNGMMISGFPLPDERRPPTHPPELTARLPPFSPAKLLSLRYEQSDRIDAYLRYNLARLEAITLEACRSGTYDVVLTCLPTPDLAHHYFWRPGDADALEHIYRYYDEFDRLVGRIVDAGGDRTTVVVFSDHGGREAPGRVFAVNRWLVDAGYLAPRQSVLSSAASVGLTNRVVDWAKRRRINHRLASHIRGSVRRRVSAMTHNTAFVDWSRSRAFGLDFTCPLAGVEINLRGRQARGVVPAADYEPLRTEIQARLTETADPASGAPVFSRVCRREELFHGPHLERFPDVVGVLNDDFDVKGRLDLPVLGPNLGQPDYPYMGYHGYDAFFCARGPAVRQGVCTAPSQMVDLAPTLLALEGVDPLPSMEGRPFAF